MELEEMKQLWGTQAINKHPIASIKDMAKEKSMPLLNQIKKQLLFEMLLWVLVLVFYHDIFDGDQRPTSINFVLVIGLLQAIAYNLSAYMAAKHVVHGANLNVSLLAYANKLKRYQLIAIGSRAALVVAMLVFFGYGLTLDSKRIVALLCIALLVTLQLSILYRQWTKRIEKIRHTANALANG